MFCPNVARIALAVESCVASTSLTRSCRRSLSSQTRSLSLHTQWMSSTGQLPMSSRPEAHTPKPLSLRKTQDQTRTYAADTGQNTNTLQGTIGKGASGVGEEAQRVKEKLQAPDHLDEKEKMIFEKLDDALEPTKLEVQDISGGCGSMYGIEIVSERFRGLSMLKQQRLVNKVLGEEIKGWHGVQLKTRVP